MISCIFLSPEWGDGGIGAACDEQTKCVDA